MLGPQIIIVEDEFIVARDIKETLSNLGYTVPAIAASGEEALKKVMEHQPDLVIMDILLKGELDGIQTADQIRLRFNIPVIYLTAHDDDVTLKRARITEPYGYLTKPYKERDLHSTIEMALYKQKMEKKLKENEQWLSITLNSISEGVIATDENGLITFMNPTAEMLLGWKHEDAINEKFNQIVTFSKKKSSNEIRKILNEVIKNGKSLEITEEITLLTRDKIELPIELSASPIIDDKHKIYGMVFLFQDITIRKEAELILKKSEERYRKLVDNFPEPMFVFGENKLKYMNQEAVKLLSATSSVELIGKSIIDFIVPKHQEDFKVRIRNIELGREKQKAIKITILCLDGLKKDVDVSASHIIYYGKPAVQLVLKDITAGREAEAALRESEEKYRSVVERANDGIAIIQDGTLKYINPKISAMFGYDTDEILGTPYLNFIHPKDRAKVSEFYSRRLIGEDVPNIYEITLIDKDGSEIKIEINAGLINYNGRPADLVLLRDISERKEVEKVLRESEEQCKILIETTPDAIINTELNGKIIIVNLKALEIYNSEKEEDLINKNIFELISPEDRKRALENLQKLIKGEPKKNINYKLVRNDGSTFFGEINSSVIFDSKNVPKSVIYIIRDITERLTIIEALRESEEKYRNLVEHSLQGIVITTGFPPKIVYVNPAIENILGYSSDEILNFKPEETMNLIHKDDLALFQQRYQSRIKGDVEPPRTELRGITRNGEVKWLEFYSNLIQYNGEPAIQTTFLDITDRKLAVQKLRESEAQFRNVLNSMGDAIHVVDKSLNFVMINDSFIQWITDLGLETNIIGENLLKIFSFLPSKIKDEYNKVFETGEVLTTEETTKIDNKEFITETRKIPVVEFGEVRQIITVVRDISHRKLTESKLLDSEKRFRYLFENSPDSISIVDRSGYIKDCNASTERLFGYAKEQIIGKKFQELLKLDPIELPMIIEKHKRLLEGEELAPMEIKIIRNDDQQRWLDILYSILKKDDDEINFQVICRDITERKVSQK